MGGVIFTNDLTTIQNGQAVTSSKRLAENFGKRHDNVIRDIEAIRKDVLNFEEMFFESTEPDSYSRPQKVYLMNRDGFTLLAMGFTGSEAMQWKIKYIQAFNEMEKKITALPQMSQMQIIAAIAQAAAEQEMQIKQLTADVQGIREITALNPIDWRKDSAVLLNKMALKLGGYEHLKDIRAESYRLLDERFGVDLQVRLTNKRRRMADEGICKSKRDKLNQLDVIADDKKLVEGYVAIIKELAIKYGA